MLADFSTFILDFIQSLGYSGVFILMTLESALIPIPSEIVMPFGGFLAHKGILSFTGVVLAGAVGNLVGSLISYYIGYVVHEDTLLRLIQKYGKFVLINKTDYLKCSGWFKKHGDGVAFFSRLIPGVRTFISLPAGIFRVNILKFSIYTFVGSLIWSYFLTYIGFYLGANWDSFTSFFGKFQYVVIAAVVFLVVYFLLRKTKKTKIA